MPRVVHFELPADEHSGRSDFMRKFLAGLSPNGKGLSIIGWSQRDLTMNLDLTVLRMVPEQVTTDTIGVESVDNSLKKIVETGGTITQPKKICSGHWICCLLH